MFRATVGIFAPSSSSHQQQEDSQPTTQLCFGVCEEARMAPDHGSHRGVVRGTMHQAPSKSLSAAVATPRMFSPDASNARFVGVLNGCGRDGGGSGRKESESRVDVVRSG